jgi:hypothetical protein
MCSHIYDAHIAKDNNVSLMWHQHGIECGVSCGTLEHLGTHVPRIETHIHMFWHLLPHITHGNKLYSW